MPRYLETSCGATAMSRGHLQRTAADYYRSRHVPERLEEALNVIYHRGPEDVYGQLADYFADLSAPPLISGVRGRKVLDGGGKVTLEAEVACRVRTADKVRRVSSPFIIRGSAASRGLRRPPRHEPQYDAVRCVALRNGRQTCDCAKRRRGHV
ncbi:hypothetical protein GDO78_019656 [Eleutherodactylus coqui]|uniref:Uncharacterized protein n=1 Tax=Eleutherodactylus coqui TaxID=57060 RepID=A0A8J6BKL7_ELECQ|nr:hypothetical protein GDO78_019656 [Eleutherodactylus coqui]